MLCNVKVSLQMKQHVWSSPQRVRGRLVKGYTSEDKAWKSSQLRELMVLGCVCSFEV